jgi:hypothetical protein
MHAPAGELAVPAARDQHPHRAFGGGAPLGDQMAEGFVFLRDAAHQQDLDVVLAECAAARAAKITKAPLRRWAQSIIPIWANLVIAQAQSLHLAGGYLPALFIHLLVEQRLHLEASCSSGSPNETKHHLQGSKRSARPVDADLAE